MYRSQIIAENRNHLTFSRVKHELLRITANVFPDFLLNTHDI